MKSYLEKIKLSQRSKDILKGLGAVLVIVLFTWAAVSIATNDQFRENIAAVNEQAAKRQSEINRKLDSARLADAELRTEVRILQNDIRTIDANQTNLQKSVNSNFNQLKQIQRDEKNYIPAATTREQLDFITKYRYTPVD